ncbi:hypothetical protein N7510_006813 [Penicillium lagena]|uniref:uncharacterized protein n=1 Tax=Penicillium lagena TaxID=94218 RepID=UPI0025402919|nr:uncharacterized protein N7510_006813 [Penicillium lagena]KAJ5610094.1 hypothetical protein N7510_006813 [Penicillium lagena]
MGLFHLFGGSSGNETCPMPSTFKIDAPEPFVSNISFHHFNMIFSGACTALACLTIFMVQFTHASHYSNPNQQRKIMRISLLIPLYSGISFLSICFPNAYVYIYAWTDFVQSITLGTFFLLLNEYLSVVVERQDSASKPLQPFQYNEGEEERLDELAWHKKRSVMVFQYPIVSFLLGIVTDITQAAKVYCLESNKTHFAHLWLSIIQYVSLGLAVMAVFRFYFAKKSELQQYRVMLKLAAFKLIVLLTFVEKIIFQILRSTNLMTPTSKLAYSDVIIGIPMLVICLQMVPLSCLFAYAYRASPYKIKHSDYMPTYSGSQNSAILPPRYYGNVFSPKIWLMMLSPMDVIRAIRYSFSSS